MLRGEVAFGLDLEGMTRRHGGGAETGWLWYISLGAWEDALGGQQEDGSVFFVVKGMGSRFWG